ncbi:unnamed protein product [Urochloa decumbens]|uniref:Uncharacterized protein n=1 Tax=Urochloa decumbens TaxID=240449 RepID=A0ABC9CK06_9POAL
MTLASTSPLSAAGTARPTKPAPFSRRLLRVSCQAAPGRAACGGGNASNDSPAPRQPGWRAAVSAALAAAVVAATMPAYADLNRFEAEQRGEFGIGSAAQFGSADLKKAVHVNENFRRANFTSADMRESDFSGSTFNGAYLEKAVAYKANFTGADLSDTLMDRMSSHVVILEEQSLKALTSVMLLLTYHRNRHYANMQAGPTP